MVEEQINNPQSFEGFNNKKCSEKMPIDKIQQFYPGDSCQNNEECYAGKCQNSIC